MRWSWKAVLKWLVKRTPTTTNAARVPSRRASAAWRRLPVLHTTVRVSPWTVAATARTATARAGTRSLVHRTPAPTGPGTAPRGRVDSLAGAFAVTADAPVVHTAPRRPWARAGAAETPAAGPAPAGATPEPAAEETLPPGAEPRRRVPVITSTAPAATPPTFTRATDEYVGEPRPVTPPPARSAFDRQLDAYRPAWLVERLQSGDDLPTFVLARREGENGPNPPGGPTLPDRQPVLPQPAPPTTPGAPRASLAESRRRALAHRSRRHPGAHPGRSGDDTAPEGGGLQAAPTAGLPDGLPDPSSSFDPTSFSDPAAPRSPSGTASGPAEDRVAGEGVRLSAGETPLPGTPTGSSPTGADHAPAPGIEADGSTSTTGEPGDDPTDAPTSGTTAPQGWEAEWSRRQANRHRHPAGRGTTPRDAERTPLSASTADTPTSGPTGRDASFVRAPAAAPEAEDPTEDDTSGAPAPAAVPVDGTPGTRPARDVRDPFRTSGPGGAIAPAATPSTRALPELTHLPAATREAEPAAAPVADTDPVPDAAIPGARAAVEPVTPAATPSGPASTPLSVESDRTGQDPAGRGPTASAAVRAATRRAADGADGTAALSASDEPAGTPSTALVGPVAPRVLPAPLPPVAPLDADAVDTITRPLAPRHPPVRSPLPTDAAQPPEEHLPLLVHRRRGSAGSVLLPEPDLTTGFAFPATAPGGPADGAVPPAAEALETVTGAPGLTPAFAVPFAESLPAYEGAAYADGGAGAAGGYGDTTAQRPHPDADGPAATALRLVHSVPSWPAATPGAAAGVREPGTHRVLYAVPQYVASLFEGAASAPGSSAHGEGDPSGSRRDEQADEMVSAEAMALAVQRTAVGSDLGPAAPDPSWTGPSAQARASTRWFGAASALHHVQVRAPQDATAGPAAGGPPPGPDSSAGMAAPEASTAPPYGTADGGTAVLDGGPGPFTFSGGTGGPGGPPSGDGVSFGGRPSRDAEGRTGVPLDQTPEWAALLDMLADRNKIHARFDDPAVLDALAGRLYERILAHVRRELVVERERHGLLAPRT